MKYEIIDFRLYLYEHQSTDNPNMPLRFLLYLSDLYGDIVKDKNLYGTKRIPLPSPHFVVFYNGTKDQPVYRELRLSEAYITKEEQVSLDLLVKVYNIDKGNNTGLMEACKSLWDYSEYVNRIRRHAEKMSIERAVEKTIGECIKEGILTDFLKKHRAEAKVMSIYEYDREAHMKMEREEHFADGFEQGLEQGRQEREELERQIKLLKEKIKVFEKLSSQK